MSRLVLLPLFLCLTIRVHSENIFSRDTVSPSSIFSIGTGMHYGFIFVHSENVKNTGGARPWGVELDINRQLLRNKNWEECNCFPRTGLLISYFDFDNKDLGKSINAAWYVEPFFTTRHRANLSLKGAAGLSYTTNPHNEESNPENQSYSMSFNAYLGLGLGVNFTINNHVHAKVSAFYNHISNGGIKDPNYGINWPAVTFQVYYRFNPAPIPINANTARPDYKSLGVRKDIILYMTQRNGYAIWGGGISLSRQISGMNAWTLGLETTVDHFVENKMKADNSSDRDFVLAGILAGHEFLMGRFNFNLNLGVYLFKPENYYNLIYQRYGLLYSLSNKLAFGISLKAHGKEANFLDGRVVFSFR